LYEGPWRHSPLLKLLRRLTVIASVRTVPYALSQHISHALRYLNTQAPVDILEIEESFGLAASVKVPSGCRTVVRLHGPWFLNGRIEGVQEDSNFRWRVRRELKAIQSADGITAPSQDVLEKTKQFYGISLPNAKVIPNPAQQVPEHERWCLKRANNRQLLFVGRYDRHKGGDLMICAFARLLENNSDLELLYVGPDRGIRTPEGTLRHVNDQITDMVPARYRDQIKLLGAQDQSTIQKLRKQALVTVIPSRYDNFPMTVIEAMMAGSPIVAARTGGIPEAIVDGETGLLFSSEDEAHLAACVQELLDDPEGAARLGTNAAVRANQLYSPTAIAEATARYYREIVAG
jgi:glycosyltransferase involved in cell wall biosynthesis